MNTYNGTGGTHRTIVSVGIGKIAYANVGRLICPAVGSCVALALRRERDRLTAMAHIFLPCAPAGHERVEMPGKYADHAIHAIVSRLLNSGETARDHLKAYFAGGARMFPLNHDEDSMDIGQRNAECVLRLLTEMGIPILYRDTGGMRARTVVFDVENGEMSITTKEKRA